MMRKGREAMNTMLEAVSYTHLDVYKRQHYIVWKAGHHFNGMAKEFRKYVISYFESECEGECSGCG